jgi:hypothetical protein
MKNAKHNTNTVIHWLQCYQKTGGLKRFDNSYKGFNTYNNDSGHDRQGFGDIQEKRCADNT